ncbi:hypothetical protein U9M48_005602, partial [Paspalum notatum var. saurae]
MASAPFSRLTRWWMGDRCLLSPPTLLALVPKRRARTLTVSEALPSRYWVQTITGSLTVTAIAEYLSVWDLLENVHLHPDVADCTVSRWTQDGQFSSRSAYQMLHGLGRVKIFLWLASRRRLWTADRRHRHGLEAHETCLLCEAKPESVDHLFVRCCFTLDVWNAILTALGAGSLGPSGLAPTSESLVAWDRFRCRWPGPLRAGADSLFALVSWSFGRSGTQ